MVHLKAPGGLDETMPPPPRGPPLTGPPLVLGFGFEFRAA